MESITSKKLIKKLELTLKKNKVDYKRLVNEFGQVEASEKRQGRQEFTFREHVRGLILAMLSNQRPWGAIAHNRKKLDKIFYDYNPEILEKGNYKEILSKIVAIKCGNRNINNQLKCLSYNINQLKKIIDKFRSIDNFVSSKTGEEIATLLSNPKSPFKLMQIGFTLAMEYLRNVGIKGMKPDLHLLRICGSERLGIFPPKVSPERATILFNEFSRKAKVNPVYLDNLFWIFGAKDYANICSAKPKCHLCELKEYCNYPRNHKPRQ